MQRRDLLVSMILGAGFATAHAMRAEARAASVSWQQMIGGSDLIVVAHVVDVFKDNGVAVARAVPKRSYKGDAPKALFFLAEGTWTCDSSDAVKGETAFFHLQTAKSQRIMFNFRKDQVVEVASKPFFLQSYEGRGRWPIESVRGTIKVNVDHLGVTDPPNSIVPEWEGRVGNLHRRVPFEVMEREIKREISRQAAEAKAKR